MSFYIPLTPPAPDRVHDVAAMKRNEFLQTVVLGGGAVLLKRRIEGGV